MRFIFLAIFVLLAAQPLPVAACDMHTGQETTHDTSGAMTGGSMDHDAQDMDCCDQGPASADDGCGSFSHCVTCPAGLVALTPSAPSLATGLATQAYLPAMGMPLNGTASPPFRPPIT